MIPKEPQRLPKIGYLYLPPYRVQGISIAGEMSSVQIPELDVTFDIGLAIKPFINSEYVALTHGHMDHSAGIAYYFSQRQFQGMGTGTVICPKSIEKPIQEVMKAWINLESQKTPFNVIGLDEGGEVEIKPNHYLRAFKTSHTVPSLGFTVVEKRSKLRADLVGLPQEKLVDLKKKGEEITHIIEVPHVCYTGDTQWGDHLLRKEVMEANILITECTFLEDEHQSRAAVGKHMHVNDIVELVKHSKAESIVLTHLSRRTHISRAVEQIHGALSEEDSKRVFILMDRRTNRARYLKQLAEAGEREDDQSDSE